MSDTKKLTQVVSPINFRYSFDNINKPPRPFHGVTKATSEDQISNLDKQSQFIDASIFKVAKGEIDEFTYTRACVSAHLGTQTITVRKVTAEDKILNTKVGDLIADTGDDDPDYRYMILILPAPTAVPITEKNIKTPITETKALPADGAPPAYDATIPTSPVPFETAPTGEKLSEIENLTVTGGVALGGPVEIFV